MEGLRVIGPAPEMACRYAEPYTELLYIDTVATLYGRNQLIPLLADTAEKVFVPITVGGGIRSLDDVRELLRHGADSVAINTAALARPELITEVSSVCGAQALTVSIEAKKTPAGWECYTDNGRNRTGKDAVAWAREATERGAGQILITSVDRDGTMRGFDLDLVAAVAKAVTVPVIASGGMGTLEHYASVLRHTKVAAVGAALHYGRVSLGGLLETVMRPLSPSRQSEGCQPQGLQPAGR